MQALADPADQRAGLAIRVGEQEGVAGLALEQRGQVGPAVLTPEDQQIGLPVAEGAAVVDLGRPLLDGAVGRYERGPRFAAVARLPPAAGLGQVPVEILRATLGSIDVAVDGLVADADTNSD